MVGSRLKFSTAWTAPAGTHAPAEVGVREGALTPTVLVTTTRSLWSQSAGGQADRTGLDRV